VLYDLFLTDDQLVQLRLDAVRAFLHPLRELDVVVVMQA
jgi:hypothetical protein